MQEESKQLIGDNSAYRLDIWLVLNYPEYSRSYFHKLIMDGHVLVNGCSVKKSVLISQSDVVSVDFVSTFSKDLCITPTPMSFDIIYEDDHLFVINKPSGLVVHPAPGHWDNTFVNGLLAHCFIEEENDKELRPGIVHRLDRETSGVLLSAKTLYAKKMLCEQFFKREIEKTYILLANGRLASSSCLVDLPIGRDPSDRKRMKAGDSIRARESRTRFEEIYHKNNVSLLFAYPETGRQHQIRVHLRSMGMTLLGDKVYGKNSDIKRHMLHAFRYSCLHPVHKTILLLEALLPRDFLSIAHAHGFNNLTCDCLHM